MSSFLRRTSLSRLAAACAAVVALGAFATAVASAVSGGPVPPPRPLAGAIRAALAGAPVEGVSARIQYTNSLLEGASLASGPGAGGLVSSPLLQGAAGRLWVSRDGRVRLELQTARGDTEVLYDNGALTVYDAATNTIYRYRLPLRGRGGYAGAASSTGSSGRASGTGSVVPVPAGASAGGRSAYAPGRLGRASGSAGRATPSLTRIEEALSRLRRHAEVSGAKPTDIAGRPAYTARISPKETGSLIGGAELSWDALTGVPLRAAIYSSESSSPVLELAASEISYGPVPASIFQITPPPGTKVHELGASGSPGYIGPIPRTPGRGAPGQDGPGAGGGTGGHRLHPRAHTVGHGIASVLVLETHARGSSASPGSTAAAGLPKVNIDGVSASELPTALGTLLSFERAGVGYLVVGALKPGAVEAVARGL